MSDNNKKKTVLVTGCCGYLGSVLCPLLARAGYHVIGADNFLHGYSAMPALMSCCHGAFEFIRADVREENWMTADLLDRADAVVPLAALVGAPLCKSKPRATTTVNRDAVEKLLGKLTRPEQKVVFPNTNSGYGKSYTQSAITEDAPLYPLTEYGKSKAEAEMLVMQRPGSTSFRLGTVFGVSPRMRMDLLVNQYVWQIGRVAKEKGPRQKKQKTFGIYEPKFRRNFVHIQDVCRAFLWALENPEASAGVFNLSLPEANLTKMDLALKCCEVMGADPSVLQEARGKDPDQRDCAVSSDRVMRAGYTFAHTLEGGIREVADYCEIFNNAELQAMRNAAAA